MTTQPTTRTATGPAEVEDVRPFLACTVLAVILRVAGPVIADVRAHAVGYAERQVCVRVGDALLYLTDPAIAGRIRQHWDAAQYLAQRLPVQVSQTWLGHVPDTYPVGISVRPVGDLVLDTKWIAARRGTRTPAHLRIQVDRLVWQVCDLQAWNVIGNAHRGPDLPRAVGGGAAAATSPWRAVHSRRALGFSAGPVPATLRI